MRTGGLVAALGFGLAGMALAGATANTGDPSDEVFSFPLPNGHAAMPALEEPVIGYARPGHTIRVCVTRGQWPREYLLLSRICKGDGQRCSVFVAVPEHDASMVLKTYDIGNPPVVVGTDGRCERPEFIPEGRMPGPRTPMSANP